MKRQNRKWIATLIASLIATTLFIAPAFAQDTLKYSCSAQIYEAFGQDRLDAFTKETGIEVELFVSSSGSALYRMMNDFSDMASTTRGLYYRYKESGYVEIPFAKDPLAVIVNKKNSANALNAEQLRDIFSKEITNWKAVGGPDQEIIVVTPGDATAAYKNFERLAMDRKEIRYDFTSYKSTMGIKAVERFPYAISFITQGTVVDNPEVKTLTIAGKSPRDADYPYFQTFYYITKAKPAGAAKKFIEFTRSDAGIAIMKEKGIVPILD